MNGHNIKLTAFIALALASQLSFAEQAALPDTFKSPGVTNDRVKNSGDIAKGVDPTPGYVNGSNQITLPPPPMYEPMNKEQRFKQAVDSRIPLGDDQIRELKKLLDAQQRASSEMPYTPPKPVISTMTTSGEPGETPVVVRLARGFMTTMVFTDETGAPWPVLTYSYDKQKFEVPETPKDTGKTPSDQLTANNTVTIYPVSAYSFGNIQVKLLGKMTPVMITLAGDQKDVDYQSNIVIRARGPNAAAPMLSKQSASFKIDDVMLSIMDGSFGRDIKSINTSDREVSVYKLKDRYFVRSKHTLLSPAWTNYQRSPDGTRVYEIQSTPVLVVSVNGEPATVSLED